MGSHNTLLLQKNKQTKKTRARKISKINVAELFNSVLQVYKNGLKVTIKMCMFIYT